MAYSPAGAFDYRNVNSVGAVTIKTGPGTLISVTINSKGGGAHTITLYDGAAPSGIKIGVIDGTAGPATLFYNVAFKNALTVVPSGGTAADITVAFA